MSFGQMPLANAFLSPEQFEAEYFFELAPAFCAQCHMVQLIEQPDPRAMFHDNYAFFSGTSQKMAAHFHTMADHYVDEFLSDRPDPFVVELGSNDGIMLQHMAHKGIRHLGVEPSANVAEVARQKGVQTLVSFFNEQTAQEIRASHGPADIISSANVMCHIPDLHAVAKGVKHLLRTDGVFVFEDPYLGDVIQKTSYDQLYDEHVYLFSAQSVMNAFGPHGLSLFHVAPQITHGGSMRYYFCHDGAHPLRPSVTAQLALENNLGLDHPETYQRFKSACEQSKADFVTLLQKLKADGKRVVGYAATSKSTTVLNYCGVGPELIEFISDTTPLKQGKYTPGTHIPVKPYAAFGEDFPDYAILFAWNHAQEIFHKEKEFQAHGGQWILFVPEVGVVA
jgi:methylation protein EvaC